MIDMVDKNCYLNEKGIWYKWTVIEKERKVNVMLFVQIKPSEVR